MIVFLAAIVASLGACGSGEPSSGERNGESFLRCASPIDDGKRETQWIPPLELRREGHDLEIRGLERGVVVIGLLAGIGEVRAATRENIELFLDRFKAAGAQLIAVAGGVGLAEENVREVIETLAAAPVPVLVSPGAQESYDVFRSVISELHGERPQIVDMTKVRRVRLGQVTLLSLPGYHEPFYLEARGRGCSYEPRDLEKLTALADDGRVNVLLSASPPRGKGQRAVDRGRGSVNIGDPELAAAMDEAGIRFGLFGHVYEAGGQSTAADGETHRAPGVWHESLFVQAGATDSLPLTLVGGGRSVGMAHLVEISGHRGRYRTLLAGPN